MTAKLDSHNLGAIQVVIMAQVTGTDDLVPIQVNEAGQLITSGTGGGSGGGSITPITRLEYRNTMLGSASQSVKNSATALYAYNIINLDDTPVFVKFYNKSSAAVVASDVPIMTLAIPALSTTNESFTGTALRIFSSGMQVLCVTGISDTDETSPSAQVVLEATYV